MPFSTTLILPGNERDSLMFSGEQYGNAREALGQEHVAETMNFFGPLDLLRNKSKCFDKQKPKNKET